MNIKYKNFPFIVKAENKKSAAGNNYLSIGLGQSKKNKEGEYETVWMNFIDKRDLLVLASICNSAYKNICDAENEEYASNDNKTVKDKPVAYSDQLDDDNPF